MLVLLARGDGKLGHHEEKALHFIFHVPAGCSSVIEQIVRWFHHPNLPNVKLGWGGGRKVGVGMVPSFLRLFLTRTFFGNNKCTVLATGSYYVDINAQHASVENFGSHYNWRGLNNTFRLLTECLRTGAAQRSTLLSTLCRVRDVK